VSITPPISVVQSFGGAGTPVPIAGGRGNSWRVGELVLRPFDPDEPPLDWQEGVLAPIKSPDFRVSLPVRTTAGGFESEGWCAWQFVEGEHYERRWAEIITVGERFHRALANARQPKFIARRTDPWAIGDRVAWDDTSAEPFMHFEHLRPLIAARRPLAMRRQLVHGDLTGNVLFAHTLAPAVIDLSPFWRPPGYASAIVVADALVWEGADESLLEAAAHIPDFPQFLVRALIMRVVVDRLFREGEPARSNDDDPFLGAVEIASRLAAT